jgi:hypothetical protein
MTPARCRSASIRTAAVAAALLLSAAGGARGQLDAVLHSPFMAELPVPAAVAGADLSGDGVVDLVVAHSFTWVSYLRGLGDGSFAAPVTIVQGVAPGQGPEIRALVLAHFDGDGLLDLVITLADYSATTSDVVQLMVGRGDGRFELSASQAVASHSYHAQVADADGDGARDVVLTSAQADVISVLFGDGDGGLLPVLETPLVQAGEFALGDVDADGVLDLVVICPPGVSPGPPPDVVVCGGDGAGGFAPIAVVPVEEASGLQLAELNGDARPDIVVGTDFSDVLVLLSDGHAWQPPVTLASVLGTGALQGGKVLLVDMNEDGQRDWLFADSGPDDVTLLLSDGAGGYAEPVRYGLGTGASAIVPLDLNADGDLDLLFPGVATNSGTVLSMLLGRGEGVLAPHYPAMNGVVDLVLQDLDGDALADLVVVGFQAVVVLRGTEGGGFHEAVVFQEQESPVAAAVGDVNEDGLMDLLVSRNQGFHQVALRLGLGGLQFGPDLHVDDMASQGGPLELVDLDGDGHLDLVAAWTANEHKLRVRRGNGGGSFGLPTMYLATHASELALADFDLDGFTDIAVGSWSNGGKIAVRLGAGNGNFGPEASWLVGSDHTELVAADLDGDGDPDLVANNNVGGGSASVLRNDGAGAFTPLATVPLPVGTIRGLDVADLDRDGTSDIVAVGYTQISSPASLTLARGLGDGSFAAAETMVVGQGPGSLLARDVDGDGAPDVVVGVHGSVTVLHNRLGPWQEVGHALAGAAGLPRLTGSGPLSGGTVATLSLHDAAPGAPTLLVAGRTALNAPFKGGVMVPLPQVVSPGLLTDAHGDLVMSASMPAGVPAGLELVFQCWIADAEGPQGYAASNGLQAITP